MREETNFERTKKAINHLAKITKKNRPEVLKMMQDEAYREKKIQECRNDIARRLKESRKKLNENK